jgi:hypothetical protein
VTIFVDDYKVRAKVGRVAANWSHLLSSEPDPTDRELLEFAKRIGLDPAWIQHAGQPLAHFDVTDQMRERALKAGAVPVTWKESGGIVAARRDALRILAEQAREPAEPAQPTVEGPQPKVRRHSWLPPVGEDRVHGCRLCGLEYRSVLKRGRWVRVWRRPDGEQGETEPKGSLPKCPGPTEAVAA